MPPALEYAVFQGTIMIVDGNPANLKLLEDMLHAQHFEVQCFPLGRMALAAAEDEPPELILLDVNTPEMNGHEVCEPLKASERRCEIPVIFISALTETEDKLNAFQSGGADYVSKPFQAEEVLARVKTHLDLRRALHSERALLRIERNLLERTLGGTVGTLMELVQMTSPVLVLRSHSIRDVVLWITKHLGVENAWQYELAARLCL